MKWSENKPPIEGISKYNHCTCETPLGEIKIEWKSCKDSTVYNVFIDYKWLNYNYSLQEAKLAAHKHLCNKQIELTEYLFKTLDTKNNQL